MNSSKVISILEKNGWVYSHCRGDHWYYKKSGFARPACVTHPKKDLPVGTLSALRRYTGLKELK